MTPLEQSYRKIPLTKGQVALVDAIDFDWLSQWNWCAQWAKHTQSYYAHRAHGKGLSGTVSMHRQILGIQRGDSRIVDHISGETLDNRRGNLRVATPQQNARNAKLRKDNKSGRKGVWWSKEMQKWQTSIWLNGKHKFLGRYTSLEGAKAAYDAAAKEHFGEFARL